MTDFQYLPYGIPQSSSFAATASVAQTLGSVPETASLAGFVATPPGPDGRNFITVNASPVLINV
jgi:hypothetical protein